MTSIQIKNDQEHYTITIGKDAFDKAWLMKLVERLRMEELAHQLDLDESIEDLGEQIKADWWAKNKARFINE
jgi:molybdate-binding protein